MSEYILVTDKDSKVIKSSPDYKEILTFATIIRKAGGEVTIFKALQKRKSK